ncbi:hypothetical protein C2E21_1998 [Chlorella sorokiniana]|uniref:Uncharacterized protein n=1 Tax=Chlorella sorokiniana TaxID=3076 RepID=A0A2P6U1H7_CHLSO|nr:hypothetical protein C2E21_1998 [Chlorella sorokiniana]|eukprot:PRW60171.1 hypothetical protein C2E21_1998 [Chlorella sorokiniana]
MAADCLSALAAKVKDHVNDHATEKLVMAACKLFHACIRVCTRTGVPEPPARFLSCVQLLLRGGAAALQYTMRQVQRRNMAVHDVGITMAPQLLALTAWQLLVSSLTDGWLHHALASAQLMEPPAWKPGSAHAQLCGALSNILSQLGTLPAFTAHAKQLQQDVQLCSGLIRPLLPALSAMAVGLQLPPERRTPECTWQVAALSGSPALVFGPTFGHVPGILHQLLQNLLLTAAALFREDRMPPQPDAERHMRAMTAAHFEALLVVMDSWDAAHWNVEVACQLLGGVGCVSTILPASARSDASLHAVVTKCMAHIPQVAYPRLLTAVAYFPNLSAPLLSEGLLDTLLDTDQASLSANELQQVLGLAHNLPAAALEVAQATAARSCAYLRCANLGGEGGPAAGQGVGSQRCRVTGITVIRIGHLLLGGATTRLARLEGWLSTLLAGPLGLPLAGLPQAREAAESDPLKVCVSLLTFVNITLVLLLPALLVVWRGAPTPTLPDEEPHEQQQQQWQRRHGIVTTLSWAARKLAAVWAAADAQLTALCRGQGLDWLHKLLLAHGVLSLLWLLSITAGFGHDP